jgi:CheY-like chemotaxis protein
VTERKRLLVVEDEEIILADLVRTLRKQGYEIVGTASSGPDAIRIASEANPDLILMDVRLQGRMDGIEAARRIREVSAVPILFVTAHARALAEDLTKWPGRYASIAKPFSPSELRESIDAILHR